MKFLCQVILEDTSFDHLTADEQKALSAAAIESDRSLRDRGILIRAQALDPPKTAKTLKIREGRTIVTDGPFSEAKEFLGGFLLIEAEDMEAALKAAAESPLAPIGKIEVRPVTDFGLWA